MTWKSATIRFDAAKEIFSDCQLEKLFDDYGTLVGYKAIHPDTNLKMIESSITKLCKRLWELRE